MAVLVLGSSKGVQASEKETGEDSLQGLIEKVGDSIAVRLLTALDGPAADTYLVPSLR